MKIRHALFLALLSTVFAALPLVAGCARQAEEKKTGPAPANITVVAASGQTMPVVEHSVGEVDSLAAPLVAAEVAGRVEKVLVEIGDTVKAGQALAIIDTRDYAASRQGAQADVSRLEALVANQVRTVERDRGLIRKNFISSARLEESESQLAALQAQLAAARAQSEHSGHNLARTRVVAPLAGRVDSRAVSAGDYVSVGKAMFQIAASDKLRVRLPFPESAAARVKPGLPVMLATPTSPGKMLAGRIGEVRPMVGTSNRAFEAIVELSNPGDWKPGASVDGEVVVEEHVNAVAVPEIAVVLRPAGKVVYVVENGRAMQRLVTTGVARGGMVEIVAGLRAGEFVAVDGAGFLTDQAAVRVSPVSGKPAAASGKEGGKS